MKKMLKGETLDHNTESDLDSEQDPDPAVLSLDLRDYKLRLSKMSKVMDSFIQDTYELVDRLQNKANLQLGESELSMERIRVEIETKTELGIELIRLHREIRRKHNP